MVFVYEINRMIKAINNSGGNVTSDTHAIYASKETEFDADLYPLEIIPLDTMPPGTACIIARKDSR